MDRRSFLKAGFAALVGALAPFKSQSTPEVDKAIESFVADGFLHEHQLEDEIVATYAVKQGVLLWGDEPKYNKVGCLLQNLVFSVHLPRVIKDCKHEASVRGTVENIIGPAPVMREAYDKFGNVATITDKTNAFRVGLLKTDKTSVWLRIPKVLLTEIGLSVEAHPDEPTKKFRSHDEKEGMIITQWVSFMGCGEPTLCDKPITEEANELCVAKSVRQGSA